MTFFKPSKAFAENKKKEFFLECHNTYPLRKNHVPEISADPQTSVAALSEEHPLFPSCFILGVIAPLNSEKLDGFLSGPPFRLLQYFYWTFPVGEVWLHVNVFMGYLLLWIAHVLA